MALSKVIFETFTLQLRLLSIELTSIMVCMCSMVKIHAHKFIFLNDRLGRLI